MVVFSHRVGFTPGSILLKSDPDARYVSRTILKNFFASMWVLESWAVCLPSRTDCFNLSLC